MTKLNARQSKYLAFLVSKLYKKLIYKTANSKFFRRVGDISNTIRQHQIEYVN